MGRQQVPFPEPEAGTIPLSIVNPNPKRMSGPALLHHLVRDVPASGSAPAIDYLCDDGSHVLISYERLHTLASKLASRLLHCIKSRSFSMQEAPLVVPLLIPQSPELYISLLAILKAGAAFCPLNLDAPSERIRFICQDVSARVVLTTETCRSSHFPGTGNLDVLTVDLEELEHADQTSADSIDRNSLQGPQSLAYVMYTSGSTGAPKGVGISHDAATQSLLAHHRHIPTFSRFLQFAAPTFDVSVFEIFFPIFRGATLVASSRPRMLDDLAAVLRDGHVDACELTPTVAGSLLRRRADAPGLRLLLTIGEMLTEQVVKEFGGGGDRAGILWGMYGPTESAIHCTLQAAFDAGSGVGNIGEPLDTVSAYILRIPEEGEPAKAEVVPLGEIGELAVGGFQLAQGYLNRPEQTAAAFINTSYGRLYLTGDKARITSEGRLQCLGRISGGQVKLRGQRIELGEIEQVLMRTPGCHGAVASVVEGMLVAFIAMDGDAASIQEEAFDVCRAWLPGFMVPGDLVLMREFPQLPSGKVDRRRLESEYLAKGSADRQVESEYTDELERRLCEIARKSLNIHLAPSSSLAASGMDSLSAIRFSSALRREGINVAVPDIIGSRTLSQLHSRALVSQKDEVETDPLQLRDSGATSLVADELWREAAILAPHRGEIEAGLFCTPLQQAMLAETSAHPGAYCNWIELRFPGNVDADSIQGCFRQVALANEILRSGFAHTDGGLVQVVWKELEENQFTSVASFERTFQLQDNSQLLRPFRIQIRSDDGDDGTAVLLQMHHALYDGWSMDLILQDLEALLRSEKCAIRPQFRQATDYYRSIALSAVDSSREFWADRLASYQPCKLPQLVSTQVTEAQTLSTSSTFSLDVAEVGRTARRLECSPQALFQGALAWLWGQILGVPDVILGSVTSGRAIPLPEIEEIMGPCINTVPVRINLTQAQTIRELFESVHAFNWAAVAHSTLPLTEIRKAASLRPGQALFNILFVYQESLYSRSRGDDALVREVAHQDFLETEILVEIEPADGKFGCRVTYRSDCLTGAYAEAILRQYASVVRYFVANLDATVVSARSCFPGKFLSRYNVHPKTFNGVADIATLVERVVDISPHKPAVCFASDISPSSMVSETISYRDLDNRANRIAQLLIAYGAQEAASVAIIMEKSVALYAGILGILKARCAYLPLLPSTPPSRVDVILQQAGVQLVLTDDRTDLILQKLQYPYRILNLEKGILDRYSNERFESRPDPSRVANIIYTSGSTGVPKGVCVTQLNISSNLDVLSRIYPVREGSRLLQSCSQAFDVSVFEILFAWTRGMCLCSAKNDTLFEDLELSIRTLEVTHLSMTPTVAALVDPANVPKVEFLVTSGEPMTQAVADKWVEQLYQGYGPSETTNICSVKKMRPGDIIHHLGFVFDNTSAFVMYLDSLDCVPLGSVGELCFGGDQVVKGYLDMPDLTTAKFVDHPEFGRLYRSGDLGRMMPDGSLMIIGRVDDQIKLRGQRIELREIDTVLRGSGLVSASVTLMVEHQTTKTQQLASFYVPAAVDKHRNHFSLLQDSEELKRAGTSLTNLLTDLLAHYMVPTYLIPIAQVPVTSSGKVHKDFLREAFQGLDQIYLDALCSSAVSEGKDEEWTDLESRIARVIAGSLNAEQDAIGRWTPFTRLGLDSISAITVARHVKEEFDQRLSISSLLQNASVARLAEFMTRNSSLASSSNGVPPMLELQLIDDLRARFEAHGKGVERVLRSTPLQEGMLVSSEGSAYLNKMLLRLRVDRAVMRRACEGMCRRHGILRTCFMSTEDRQYPMVQVILEDWLPSWDEFDVSKSGSFDECISTQAGGLAEAVDSMIPPVSFAIIRDRGTHFLSIVCHHALYDGVAIGCLLHEIELACCGQQLPVTPSYEAVLEHMFAHPEGEDEFWQRQLSDYRPRSFPALCAESGVKGMDSHITEQLAIPLSRVDSGIRDLGVSLLSICQAAWAAVLRILMNADDVCFGNVVSGRSMAIEGIERLVAPCFNTVPVRVDTGDMLHNVDLIRHLQSLNPQILEFQFTPLRKIQSLCSRDGRHLFDTLLLLQQPVRELDQSVWSLERDDGEMDYPLACEVTPSPKVDSVEVKIHYDESIISASEAQLIYSIFSGVIQNSLDFPLSHLVSKNNIDEDIKHRLGSLHLEYDTRSHEHVSFSHVGDDSVPEEQFSDTERAVRSIISALASRPESSIRRQTTIYQLGLDSISAVQVAAMLRKLGFAVTSTEVIGNPTCARLGGYLDKKSALKSLKEDPAFNIAQFRTFIRENTTTFTHPTSLCDSLLPCTPLQQGILSDFIRSQGSAYMNFITYKLSGTVSSRQLAQAWTTVFNTNSILRTGFIPVEHRDFSYAMIQYQPADIDPPVKVMPRSQQLSTFDVENWRIETREATLQNLDKPPWRLVITEGDDGGLSMHLAIHHALYDAHSLRSLLYEVAASLNGKTVKRHSGLVIPVQDILNRTASGEDEVKAYWEAQSPRVVINRFPSMTPLRLEKRNILVEKKIAPVLFGDLEKAAAKSGFTLQALIQAAWTRVLSAYHGEGSVTFGVVLSGRNSEATAEAVFPCISTLPVIAENKPSNRELLEQMMSSNAALHRRQHFPLNKIQRWLGRPDTSLFDTLIVYQRFDDRDSSSPSVPWELAEELAKVDYPISIEVEPQLGGNLEYRVTFFDDIIPRKQAQLLLEQFHATFSHLAYNPDGYESDLAGTSSSLFSIEPAAEPELPSQETLLHHFLEMSAGKYPDRTALRFVTGFDGVKPICREWTYKEMSENGDRVARILSPHVRTGDIVAVLFDKCPEAYFTILGVLKSGCAFLALDPSAPPARKEFILRDSGAVVLITDEARMGQLDFSAQVPVVGVDERALRDMPASPVQLTRPVSPADTCYCLYTSGTTGTPKGCEITHKNAVQAMLAFQRLFVGHWDENSKWLQFASLHFDVSVLEQYWTWSVGIALVAAPRDLILEDLSGTISRLDITHLNLTPSLARLVHPDEVPSLCRGVFITGGEQLKQEILDVWGPRRVIHNFYGPTEATIGVTSYPCVPKNGRSSNIGRQFMNAGTFVLHPGTETPVIRGGVGELCVSGMLVGKGYLHRDELTAERFPTLKAFDERVYRTGDLVRMLYDGCFEFLGRADDQVKLRGQRLEIGEINSVMRDGVPEIADIATLVIRNEKQQKDFLVTFVVAPDAALGDVDRSRQDGLRLITDPEAGDICQRVRSACRRRLPGYMVPTYVLPISRIPLSSNNKAEMKELRWFFGSLAQDDLLAASSRATVPVTGTNSPAEKTIIKALWDIGVAGDTRIDSQSSLFDLGIDSISVLRFARALKRAGLAHASPNVILRNPVIGDLAAALSSAGSNGDVYGSSTLETRQVIEAFRHRYMGLACKTLGVSAEEVEYVVPCSSLQQGMLSRSQSGDSPDAYFNSFRFVLEPDVRRRDLREAWERVVQENAILRTRFVSTADGFVQVALKNGTLSWEERTVSGDEGLEALFSNLRAAWIQSNSAGVYHPLQGVEVLSGEKCILVLHIFHALYDANSLDLMLDRVIDAYHSKPRMGSIVPYVEALLLGPLKDYGFSRPFWEDHLRGLSWEPFPSLTATPSSSDSSVSRTIDFNGIDTARRALGVTHQAIVQAVWISVLQKSLRQGGVSLGVIVAGRSIRDAEDVIGPLFNTIPFYHNSSEGETWESLVWACHDYGIETLPFQHVPLRDVQKWCAGGRPIFDILFTFSRRKPVGGEADALWEEMDSGINPDYPLALEAVLENDNKLRLLLVAKKGIADEGPLSAMLDEYEAAATALYGDPQGSVHSGYAEALVGPSIVNGQATVTPSKKALKSHTMPSHFEWDGMAAILRDEIALLSQVSVDSIDENISLLELGLDSIDMIKLSARLRRSDIRLTNSQLMRGQTISAILDIAEGYHNLANGSASKYGHFSVLKEGNSLREYLAGSGSDLADVEQVLPVTPLQDTLVAHMVWSDFRWYFNHDVLEVRGDVDIERLKRAWQTVVNSSPVLRTAFVEVKDAQFDAAYCQLVLKDNYITPRSVRIDTLEELPSVMENSRQRAFEGRGKSELLQTTWVEVRGRSYLVLSIAHALYDGWSLALMHQDVDAAYHGTYVPRASYVNYLGHILEASSKPDARQFWSEYLKGAVLINLPAVITGDTFTVDETHSAHATSSISSRQLKDFCKQHSVTLQALGQACWTAVLATKTRSLDITFGVMLSGRETEAADELLFPTMNTVAVRSVLHSTISGFLRYMQENLANISQHQHFPLRKVWVPAGDGPSSLFNTLFILQKPSEGLDEAAEEKPLMRSIRGSAKVGVPVCVEMQTVGRDVVWRTACSGIYIREEESRALPQELDAVLNFIVRSPQSNILRFEGDAISVAGMPAFSRESVATNGEGPGRQRSLEPDNDTAWSPVEKEIRSVLSEVSGIPPSSIQKSNNIYHLSLDSIIAIKVAALLKKKGVRLSMRDLLEAKSIKQLALAVSDDSSHSEVEQAQGDGVLPDPLAQFDIDALLAKADLSGHDCEEILPATPMQAHMISAWQNSNGAIYFPEFRYRLRGPEERSILISAWASLVAENPVLRTAFVATGSRDIPLLQLILKTQASIYEGISSEVNGEHWTIITGSPIMSKCSLATLAFRRDAAETWTISLKIHHALYDGITLPSLMARFASLCAGRRENGDRISTDLVGWKKRTLDRYSSRATDIRRPFWTRYLAGATQTPFLSFSGVEDRQSLEKNRRSTLFRPSALPSLSRVKAVASAHGLGVQSLFLAAYARSLATLIAEERPSSPPPQEVVFGVYLANRRRSLADGDGAEDLMPTLAILPLRVRVWASLGSSDDIQQIASRIQRDLRDISAPGHVDASLWEIGDWVASGGGVRVDSFVNFLSLPEDGGGRQQPGEGDGDNVFLEQVREGMDSGPWESLDDGGAKGSSDPAVFPWLQDNPVRDSFSDAVDIEAGLNSKDGLDIGIFGPARKLGADGCRRVMELIVGFLGELS